MKSVTRRRVLQGAATLAGGCAFGRIASAEAAPGAGQRRSCYVNFAEHLLNAYNPNMIHPDLPNRWSDGSWRRFIEMIADFGFTHFEFWLVPRLFSRAGLEQPFGEAFAEQMNAIIAHGRERGVGVKLLAALTTVGDDWHTHCPRVREEWDEVVMLWDRWTKRLPGLGVVGIFPGDPGGCSRNGCTARTFVDGALEISDVVKKNQPQAEIEIGTWGTPFWGWGTIEGPPGWKGEFIPSIQHSAWRFDKQRADESMTYLLRRLPDFPADSSVAINLAFNSDGDPDQGKGEADASLWAREIAKTNRVLTWDFSLTEGENAVMPHHRFGRLFAQRKRERAAAPYSGGICFTMTPLLNQLSLHQAARSFIDPDADPAVLARRFYGRLFGAAAEKLNDLLPLFEVIPDWGNYNTIDLPRAEYHARMQEGVELLRGIEGKADDTVPFLPSPEEYRRELLFFFELFRDLTGAGPDFDALAKRYWQRVYAIYDRLPRHVDPRPHAATERLIRFFDPAWKGPRSGPLPGKWTS